MSLIEDIKEKLGFSDNTLGTKISIEEKYEQRETTFKFFIAILVLVIGIMGIAYLNAAKDKYAVIEIPGTIYAETPLKVGNGWTNDMMLKVWADWLVNTTSNINPADVKEKLNEGMKMFSQSKLSLYSGQLGALSNLVIRNQLKQVFTIKNVSPVYYSDVDFKNVTSGDEQIRSAIFEYKGVATQILNSSALPDRQCSYKISLVFEGGHLYCTTYDTDCFK